jgi:diadenosine tetraphosphate (Ap4A) HIT family hydrolase
MVEEALPMTEFELNARLLTDTHPVTELSLCSVLLMDDARFPWLVLVPRRHGATEIVDLEEDDQRALLSEINQASLALREIARPDKLNIAALGNVVPQLHVHVIARSRDDEAWPRPVFGVGEPRSYDPAALSDRLERLASALLR